MEKKFLKLVEQADRILVTSHISPDPDAIASALLTGRTLAHNFPEKSIDIALAEQPAQPLDFLIGYEQIKFQPLDKAISSNNPDLLIVVDANSLPRISRHNSAAVKELLDSGNTKLAIIDHHEMEGAEDAEIFINTKRPATAEEIFYLFFDVLDLKKPAGYAETTLLGIISDTQRHRFEHPGYRETFRIVSELLDAGASVEKLEAKTESYSKDELLALSQLTANITSSGLGYSYSYISDDFFTNWQNSGKSNDDMKRATEEFANRYIKSFEGNGWGFIVSPEPLSGKNWWGVSLRALSGVKDVSVIARALGGGGHKPAAGAKIQAENVQEAIKLVKRAISA